MPFLKRRAEFGEVPEMLQDMGRIDGIEGRVLKSRQVACVSDVIDMRARIGVHDLPARRHDPAPDMEATMRSDSRAGRI
jgi:hypothetical protein